MREVKRPYYVSEVEYEAAMKWLNEVARPAAIKKQRLRTRFPARVVSDGWRQGYPYRDEYGFVITPTEIGPLVEVYHSARGLDEVRHNVTDYSSW